MYPLHDCEMQDIMVCLTKQKSDSLIIKDLVIDSSKIQILLYQGKFLLKINTYKKQTKQQNYPQTKQQKQNTTTKIHQNRLNKQKPAATTIEANANNSKLI